MKKLPRDRQHRLTDEVYPTKHKHLIGGVFGWQTEPYQAYETIPGKNGQERLAYIQDQYKKDYEKYGEPGWKIKFVTRPVGKAVELEEAYQLTK